MSSHLNASYNFPQLQMPFAHKYSDGRASTSALPRHTSIHLGADDPSPSGHNIFSPEVLSTSVGKGDMSSLSDEFLDSLGLPSTRSRSTAVSLPSSHHPSSVHLLLLPEQFLPRFSAKFYIKPVWCPESQNSEWIIPVSTCSSESYILPLPLQSPTFDSRPGSVASFASSDRGNHLVVEQLRHEVRELTRANQILKAEMSMLKYVATFKMSCNLL